MRYKINLWVQVISLAVAFSFRMIALGWLILLGILVILMAFSPLIVAAAAVPPQALNRRLIALFLATDVALVAGAATFPDFDDTDRAIIPLLRIAGHPDPSTGSPLAYDFAHVGVVALLAFLLLSIVTLVLVLVANLRHPR